MKVLEVKGQCNKCLMFIRVPVLSSDCPPQDGCVPEYVITETLATFVFLCVNCGGVNALYKRV